MASQPTVTIEERLSAGWELWKRGWELCRQHQVLSVVPSVVGAFIYISPGFLFFAAPLYAVACYMTVKSKRGEAPRMRDIFKEFHQYWGALCLWLFLIALILLCTTTIGFRLIPLGITRDSFWLIPLVWAILMLVFPPLTDEREAVGSALGAAFKIVFTWKNWARFWLYGLIIPLVSCVGIFGIFFGLLITIPLAVCIRVIIYGDTFEPAERLQQERTEPSQGAPFTTEYIGPIARIHELRNQIFEQIRSANDSVKPMLEGSIEYIDNVFWKAVHLSQHLRQIDDYLETTNMQRLQTEKIDITRKLTDAPNTAVSDQYEEALRALDERIENHGRLEELSKQIDARLMTIRISLDNTLAKIIQIKTTEISNARLESHNVSEALQDLQIEINALLESLDERSGTLNDRRN